MGSDFEDHLVPTPCHPPDQTAWGLTPHSTWPRTPPGMRYPQLLWVTCSNSQKDIQREDLKGSEEPHSLRGNALSSSVSCLKDRRDAVRQHMQA